MAVGSTALGASSPEKPTSGEFSKGTGTSSRVGALYIYVSVQFAILLMFISEGPE